MAIKTISILTIVLVLLFPVLTLIGVLFLDQMKSYMLIGSIVWFVLAPFWIKKD